MKRCMLTLGTLALCAPALAQTGQLAPQTRTVVTPVAPPATAVAQVAPGTFVVTPVPGIAAATRVRIQKFGDYDLDKDGSYGRMEFAQALYFLATSDPVAGNPRLPAGDIYTQKGAPQKIDPRRAAALLNATSDEFTVVDRNKDDRVDQAELTAVALM